MSADGNNVITDDDDKENEDDCEIFDGYQLILGGSSNVVPSIWFSLLIMSAYLDCGIHLVFHGIVFVLCQAHG